MSPKALRCGRALLLAWWASAALLMAEQETYLFIGHPRDDGPDERLQREVERIEFSAFDRLLLGGDYTWRGTGDRETVAYLDAVFDLGSPNTHAVLGNHDTQHPEYFEEVSGRARFHVVRADGITWVMLDTTLNGGNIVGDQLQLLGEAVEALATGEHLVVVHHHLIWLSDYAPLSFLMGSPLIGASSANLSGLNFHSEVYPLLQTARGKGGEVICLAGDRTGTDTEEYYVDHTTTDGVRFIGAGLKEELTPGLRTVVVLHHDQTSGELTVEFQHLTDLPRVPDEPLLINELHYRPPQEVGNDHAFVELYNAGDQPYDLSGASFVSGITLTFPSGTIVPPGHYLLLSQDPSLHESFDGLILACDLDPVRLTSEPIQLRDAQRLEVDLVAPDDSAPWPTTPDGGGPSLMLIQPGMDNESARNWAASDQPGGTPGRPNLLDPKPISLRMESGMILVRWENVVPGAGYQLWHSGSISLPDWQPAGSLTTAVSTTMELPHSVSAIDERGFYRLGRPFEETSD